MPPAFFPHVRLHRHSQFFLDPDGRVPFAGEVSFDFRSAPKALTAALTPPEVLAQIVKDCQVCVCACVRVCVCCKACCAKDEMKMGRRQVVGRAEQGRVYN